MNEINKLKAEHDALYEQGAEHLRLMNECGEKVIALRERIKALEGDDYEEVDEVFLLFNGTFEEGE